MGNSSLVFGHCRKTPFRPLFRAFYPHPAHGSSLRGGRGSCGMPYSRRCPLANWPRISVGNWAPPPKERKGPPTFWHQGNVVVPFRLRHASRLTPHASRPTPHVPRLTSHAPRSSGSVVDAARRAGYPSLAARLG